MGIKKFDTIAYPANGTNRQQQAYQLLIKHSIFSLLNSFSPILTGTIPINIDIESSDLDIICEYDAMERFELHLTQSFSKHDGFSLQCITVNNINSVLANFTIDGFPIEIFGQAVPVKEQMAYRHMIIEHKILLQNNEAFRQLIIGLKKQGFKTEPAFAEALKLNGDPYLALLDLSID